MAVKPNAPLQRLIALATAPWADAGLRGFVDGAVGAEVSGWAFDVRQPNRRVLVVAKVGEEIVAEALADLPRRDLAHLKGDGRHGFRLKLPLDRGPISEMVIEGQAGKRRRSLKRAGRLAAGPAAPAAPAAREPPRTPTVGFLERCANGVLRGWAINPNNPSAPCSVDVFDGEVFLGAAAANIDRPRLRETSGHAGGRGFEFILPTDRRIAPEDIRARVTGTRFDLKRSRSYVEGAPGAPDSQDPASTGGSEAAAPWRSTRVAFLICGPGSEQAVAQSTAACVAQAWPDTVVGRLGAGGGPREGVERFEEDDDERLTAWLSQAQSVVFLEPGQGPGLDVAERVHDADPLLDVIFGGQAGLGAEPDFAVFVGAASGGLAVRAPALRSLAGGLPAAALAGRGLAAVEDALAWVELGWGPVDGVLGGAGRPGSRPTPPAVTGLRRLSLCMDDALDDGAVDRIEARIAAAAAFELEVLLPVAAADLSRRVPRRPGLQFRVVDTPEDRARWSSLLLAATGEAAVVYGAKASLDSARLDKGLALAMRPRIGAVSVSQQDGANLVAAPSGTLSPDLMIVSRVAVAEADNMTLSSVEEPDPARLFAAQLRAANRRCLSLSPPAAAPGQG